MMFTTRIEKSTPNTFKDSRFSIACASISSNSDQQNSNTELQFSVNENEEEEQVNSEETTLKKWTENPLLSGLSSNYQSGIVHFTIPVRKDVSHLAIEKEPAYLRHAVLRI